MIKINRVLPITSVSIFLGLAIISILPGTATTGAELSLSTLQKSQNQKNNQIFIPPNRGTPTTTAGGGIRGIRYDLNDKRLEFA